MNSKIQISIAAAVLCLSSQAHAGRVYLSGGISKQNVSKAVAKVADLYNKGDRNITLELNSVGGDLQAALRALPQLRAYGVNTSVSSECSSACTVLFAAGKTRSASSSAEFLFHAPKVAAAPGSRVTRAQREAYVRQFAASWTNAIRSVSPSLAHDLESRKILLRGEKTYSGRSLRKLGYVND